MSKTTSRSAFPILQSPPEPLWEGSCLKSLFTQVSCTVPPPPEAHTDLSLLVHQSLLKILNRREIITSAIKVWGSVCLCKCPSPDQNVPDLSMSPSPESPGLLQLLKQPSTKTGQTQSLHQKGSTLQLKKVYEAGFKFFSYLTSPLKAMASLKS